MEKPHQFHSKWQTVVKNSLCDFYLSECLKAWHFRATRVQRSQKIRKSLSIGIIQPKRATFSENFYTNLERYCLMRDSFECSWLIKEWSDFKGSLYTYWHLKGPIMIIIIKKNFKLLFLISKRGLHIFLQCFFFLFHCFSEVLVLSYEKSPSEVSLHNEFNFLICFLSFFLKNA